jgi:hypothetical protein
MTGCGAHCESLRGLLCASAKLKARNSEMKSARFKNVLARQAAMFNENTDKTVHWVCVVALVRSLNNKGLLPLGQELQDGPALLEQPATLHNTVPAAFNPAVIEMDYLAPLECPCCTSHSRDGAAVN